MDNLELLSDEELRSRLMHYGFPNLPVTSSTRKLLIKKIRNHMENQKAKVRRETRSVTRYSSGEESDGDKRSSRKASATYSNTARATMLPPPAKVATPGNRVLRNSAPLLSNNNNDGKLFTAGLGGKSTQYISPVIINDSEDDDYSAELRATSRTYGNANQSPSSLFRPYSTPNRSPLTTSYRATKGSGTPSNNDALNDSTNSNGSASNSPFSSEYTARLLQLRGETMSHENYNSTITNAIGGRTNSISGEVTRSGLNLNHAGAPISGNHFRSRYSHAARYSTGNNIDAGGSSSTGGSYFNENDIVTHAQPSPEPPPVPVRVALGNLVTKLDEHYGFKQTFIPCALLCLFVAFLVFVAFMYMTISTDIASTLTSINTRYDICQSNDINTNRCLNPTLLDPTLDLLKLVGTELKTRVEHSKCVDSKAPFVMSADEVLKFGKEHQPHLLIPQLTRHLHSMEYLISQNPQWRINHCDQEGNEIDFEEVLRRRPTKSNYFTILKPKLPLSCTLYNKFYTFFVIVGVLGLIGIVIYLGNYFLKFVLYVKQKRKDQVNALIGDIIQAVSQAATNNESSDDGLVVVNHLRDSLISPDNRKKLEWAWVEALQFLEQNESRIQFEVGHRGGEDFKMMRWIDTAPLNASSSAARAVPGGAKKWQSPAFDNTNKIPDPPTPCLKIRQMFDKYEVNDPNLKTIVQDAILEKVGMRCKIYDIQLDRNSCCVYVRCASAKDAGIVHDEINGWWFDNRLVSIKFLRLERYLARFPRASAGPVCLKPSNRNNSSMSQQQPQSQSQQYLGDRPSNALERDDDEEEDDEEDELELEQE